MMTNDVIIAPRPFTPQVERLETPAGFSVLEILKAAVEAGHLAAEDLPRAEVYLAGERLPHNADSLAIRPASGTVINVAVMPAKGSGKNFLEVILEIAVIALSVWVGQPQGALAFLGSSTGATIIRVAAAAAITIAGGALIRAISGDTPPEIYSLETIQNQQRPRQPFLLALGPSRVALDALSSAYTSTSGDNTYLHAILGCHYGPCTVSDIKIGESLISAFASGQVQTEEFLTPGVPRTSDLYPGRVVQENYTDEMDHIHMDWEVHTSAIDAEAIEWDIFCPVLFFKTSDSADLYIDIEYSPVGAGTWSAATGWTVNDGPGPTEDRHGTTLTAGQLYITGATHNPIRLTVHWVPPDKGQYDVRMRRNVRPDDNYSNDAVYWSAMRTIENQAPILDQTVSCIFIQIEANADVYGTLPGVSAVVTPVCPLWNGTSWASDDVADWEPTSNQAAIARWLLMYQAAAEPLDAGEIDASFATQYELIEAQGWGTGLVINTDNVSQDDALALLGSSGRFQAYWNGQAMCLVPDWEKDGPRQLFTGRNAASYRKKRTFPPEVDAVLVEFNDVDNDCLPNMVTVYADGFDEGSANLFETLELKFVCDNTRASQEGNVYLAKRARQQTTHEWTSDADSIVATLGDRVVLERRSALFELQSRRVLFRRFSGALVTGVRLDGAVSMTAEISYAMDARTQGQTLRGLSLQTTAGLVRDVLFATPLAADAAPEPGDLVVVGVTNTITLDLEVIDVQGVAGQTASAQITAVDYIGDEIVAAWDGAPEAGGATLSNSEVAPPVIILATGNPAGVVVDFAAMPQRVSPIDHFSARWRLSPNSTNPYPAWLALPDLPSSSRELKTPAFPEAPGIDGYNIDVELRTVLKNGQTSQPGQAYGITIGLSLFPPDDFSATGVVRLAPDGSSYGALYVHCDAVTTGNIQDLIVQIRPTGTSDPWVSIGQPLPAANPVGDFTNVMGGQGYDVQAQWRSSDNWTSAWVEVDDVVIPTGADVAANAIALGARLATTVLSEVDAATTDIAANVAALLAEVGDRTAGDAALSATITALTVTVSGNTSAITSEATTRASADSALSASITSLTSTVSGNTSAITSEAATRASADTAISATVTTLSATVSGQGASITTQAAAISTLGQVYGTYSLTVNSNGNIAGLTLLSASGPTSISSVVFEASDFIIRSSTHPDITPFLYDATSGTLFLQTITVQTANIANANVTTLKVAGGAISNTVEATATVNLSASVTTYAASGIYVAATTTLGGTGPVLIQYRMDIDTNTTSVFSLGLFKDGTQVDESSFKLTSQPGFNQSMSSFFIDPSPSSGSHIYGLSVKTQNTGTETIKYGAVSTTELKK